MKDAPLNRIGVFDSGVGGLTVLKELTQQLPHESILYFGDTARLPYGIRSKAEILQFVREILIWMASHRVKMVIMACNTSSALALEEVRREFPFPILGLILPAAKAAIRQGQRVGVIATPATVTSQAYHRAILEIKQDVTVWQVGCPEFVPLIEAGRIHDPYTHQVAYNYLQPLMEQEIDTLIYGCTHYPHLAPVIRQILPPTVRLVNPAQYVAQAAEQELELLGLKSEVPAAPTEFYVSGDPEQFAQLSQRWLGFCPVVQQVSVDQVAFSYSVESTCP
ncbi:glutamate racemase [Spirulina subsalsa FACHB-351]|uniref:Glutamate racemase n=1 Tax=Spirulina subsalsa FACHB-351 TaxID=234711 RepID=A0ABT3LD36_9CYAN|nr:glutamate racemase [Spirulina subsalsa]MCW6039024.1 glutamate racemase [Spirulina subsalsa FACHB-351]